MKRTTEAKTHYGSIAILVALALFQISVDAQGSDGQERGLVGVWEVTTTPRECVTGVPIPARAFRSIWTFHQDGTMTATNPPVTLAAAPPSTATINRLVSYGIWKRKLGWSDYLFKFVHLRFDATTRAFAGKQEGYGSLALSESGDAFTSDGVATPFDANDSPLTPGCANSVGTRFGTDLGVIELGS
jgi:hypothetical protein